MRSLTRLVIIEAKERETESIGAGDQWDVENKGEGGLNLTLNL